MVVYVEVQGPWISSSADPFQRNTTQNYAFQLAAAGFEEFEQSLEDVSSSSEVLVGRSGASTIVVSTTWHDTGSLCLLVETQIRIACRRFAEEESARKS